MKRTYHRHGKGLHSHFSPLTSHFSAPLSQFSTLHSPFRTALTLIEVLAALTILGTTITSMLVAYGQAMHQTHHARLRRETHQHAAELLVQWELDAEPLDTSAQGTVADALDAGARTEYAREGSTMQAGRTDPRRNPFLRLANEDGTSVDPRSRWHWTRTVRRRRPTPQTEMNEITLTIERQPDAGPRERLATLTWLTAVPPRPEPAS